MRSVISMVVVVLVLIAGQSVLGGPAGDQPKPRLVVFDLEPKGVAPELARNVTDAILGALQAYPDYRVMGRNEIKVILEHEGSRGMMECAGEECLLEMGELVKSDLILSGSVITLGLFTESTARLIVAMGVLNSCVILFMKSDLMSEIFFCFRI